MPKVSAGLLLYSSQGGAIQVLLVHPGGPFWRRRDAGAWSIPKGEVEPGEDLLCAARREVAEETGIAPDGPFIALGSVRQRAGKEVHAWACEAQCDPASVRSNEFEIEWPPGSGRRHSFPEIDRAGLFDLADARIKLNQAQVPFVDALERALSAASR
jgi:predicted NUDIX family NTP pyrophosphohydrolase